jgi:hypothetical protein
MVIQVHFKNEGKQNPKQGFENDNKRKKPMM